MGRRWMCGYIAFWVTHQTIFTWPRVGMGVWSGGGDVRC